MPEEHVCELITTDALVGRVRELRERGFRMVQIGANRLSDRVEVTYSFDRNQQLQSLRVHLSAAEPRVPSISSIYPCVVLYENEMHDLFKIKVEGMAVDFQGNLYRTSVKFPFATAKPPVPPKATAPVSAPAGPTQPVAPVK